MHTGHNDNLIVNDAVVKPVREATEKCAVGPTMDNGELLGVCRHRLQDRVRRCKKLFTKTSLLSLVPSVGVFNVRRRRRTDDWGLHLGRLRICRRTSSQGMPSGPERSRSSNRRSNSSRCASVRGTAPGDSLRLSHSSSISRNRSSELRLSMFRAGLLMDQVCHFCDLSATPRDSLG